jgi:hypothetical protein
MRQNFFVRSADAGLWLISAVPQPYSYSLYAVSRRMVVSAERAAYIWSQVDNSAYPLIVQQLFTFLTTCYPQNAIQESYLAAQRHTPVFSLATFVHVPYPFGVTINI